MNPNKPHRWLKAEDVAEKVETQASYADLPNDVPVAIVTFVKTAGDVRKVVEQAERNCKNGNITGWWQLLAIPVSKDFDGSSLKDETRVLITENMAETFYRNGWPALHNIARNMINQEQAEVLFFLNPNNNLTDDQFRERIKPFISAKPFGAVGKLTEVTNCVREEVYERINEVTSAPIETIKEIADIENTENMRALDWQNFAISLYCFDRVGGVPLDIPYPFEDMWTRIQMLHFPLLPQPA